MRKYLYIILAIAVFSSCESELEFNAPSQLTPEGFWEDESGAVAAHSGLYGSLRSQIQTVWLLGEIRSDAWGGTTFETEAYRDLIRSNISISNAPFGNWGGFYSRIYQVNDFIKNAPTTEFSDKSEFQHFMGEAYGLRALYYYTLLKTWGEVPITTEPYEGDKTSGLSRERSSQSEVMQLIQDDIEKSLEAFGDDDSYWKGNRNYWSKAASLTLKGDVYLWAGNILEGGNEDYQTAKNALEEVSGMGLELVPNYKDLWGTENESNNEFIFAIDYEEDEAENFFNSFTGRSTEIHQNYNEEGKNMGDKNFVIGGANRFGPSDKTLKLTDDNKDSRKRETFIRLFKDDNGGSGYKHFNETKYFGAILNKFLGTLDGSSRIFDSDCFDPYKTRVFF